ncbi:adapter protein MecA 1/2 [Seinonella peptonophila]|uniref:Adapter protein MecA 1/2 n=1 Tax=Seinonella peptonophila TaxID=112248 RepID=A0A1M4THM9_9BACL|nr:genetic competence negative regulator [Seinonella peptonophila]SHE43983.1 adapter protein MecA 1/2 [Seinonella peptonophila]
MRVERLGGDKIRFFLTLDDLIDRGIEKEEMWRDIPKVHELFNDMMEHAYQELGFEVAGPVAVEVFALPAQGMVVVVTRGRSIEHEQGDFDHSDIYELEVTMEETDEIIFRFSEFEDLIQAAIRIQSQVERGGKVFAYQDDYYLIFDSDLETDHLETVVAILSEFGETSTVTAAVLQEYGKEVFANDAVNQLVTYFG